MTAVPSTLTERIDSREAWIGSAAAAWTSDVGALDERGARRRRAHVAVQLVDAALELLVVERREVERPHLVPVGHEPPREVQAEEARPRRRSPRAPSA